VRAGHIHEDPPLIAGKIKGGNYKILGRHCRQWKRCSKEPLSWGSDCEKGPLQQRPVRLEGEADGPTKLHTGSPAIACELKCFGLPVYTDDALTGYFCNLAAACPAGWRPHDAACSHAQLSASCLDVQAQRLCSLQGKQGLLRLLRLKVGLRKEQQHFQDGDWCSSNGTELGKGTLVRSRSIEWRASPHALIGVGAELTDSHRDGTRSPVGGHVQTQADRYADGKGEQRAPQERRATRPSTGQISASPHPANSQADAVVSQHQSWMAPQRLAG